MRVSSLSDPRVLRQLSKFFVPVWFSRDHYQLDPPSKEEQQEMDRIDRERLKKKLLGGTVCVYMLDSDGTLLATLPVQKACKPENLTPFLQKIIDDKKLKPRTARPAPAAVAQQSRKAGTLRLRVWTRYDDGSDRGAGSDRLDLEPADWAAFVPSGKARPGASWAVSKKVTDRLLQLFYPPGPSWQAKDSKVAAGRLTATVASATPEEVRVRLTGDLDLRYPYTGKPTDGRLKATLVGELRYRPEKKAITSFLLTAERASFVWYWQGKAQPARNIAIGVESEP
jgi:hypothetical protein